MDIHEVRNALYNSVVGPGAEAFAALKRNIREEIIPPLMKQQMDVAFTRVEGVINAANRYTYFPNGISLGVVLAVNLFKLLRMVFVRSMKYYRNRRKKSARQRNEKKEAAQEEFDQILDDLDFDAQVMSSLVREQMLEPGNTVVLHKSDDTTRVMVDIQTKVLGQRTVTLHYYKKIDDKIAEGGSGKVYSINSLVIEGSKRTPTESNLILKKLKSDVAESKPEEIEQEVNRLVKLKSKYVQKPPHAVMKVNGKVTGYLAHKYEGDGNAFVTNVLQDKERDELEIAHLKLNALDRLSRGILHVWKKGYMHKDHKLANVLYDKKGIVIADVGGDQKFDDFMSAVNEFMQYRNYVIDYRSDSNVSRQAKEEAQEMEQKAWTQVLGARTQSLTNPHDFNALTALLRPKTASGSPLKIEDVEAFMGEVRPKLEELQNKMIVYGHGLLALSLIGGVRASELHVKWPELFVSPDDNEEGGSLGYVKLKEGVSQATFEEMLKDALPTITTQQMEIVWNSLSDNYRQRPLLEEFSKAFKLK